MSFWLDFLPIIIYVLLIVILLVGILLGVKFIFILGKAEKLVDNVNEKVKSLDGMFHIIDTATDKIVFVTDKIIDFITTFIAKLFMNNENNETKKKVSKKKEGKK